MAKMFYSADDVRDKLNITEDQLKEMVQEGKLREFLDGGKKIYKVSDVDNMAGDFVDASEGDVSQDDGGVDLSASSSEIGLMPLDDSTSNGGEDDLELMPLDEPEESPEAGTDDQINLSDASGEIGLLDTGSSIGLLPEDSSADQINLDDTNHGDGETKDDTVLTEHGVDVVDDDDEEALDISDPLAQTQIAPDLADQVDLDGGSGGSGLLDLSREADDTSLGAELLDEIYPTGGETGNDTGETEIPTQFDANVETQADEGVTATLEMPAQTLVSPEYTATTQTVIMDPNSVTYGVVLLVALVFLVILGCISSAAMAGLRPAFIQMLQDNLLIVLGGGIGLMLLAWGIGSLITKQSNQPRTAKVAKAKKAAKAKPKKEPKPKKKNK